MGQTSLAYYPGRDRPHAPRSPNADDLQQTETMRRAAQAVRVHLKAVLTDNPHRLIRNLKRHEIEGIAVAAIAAYIEAVSLAEFLEDLLGPPEIQPLSI